MHKSIGRLVSILYRKNQMYFNMALKSYNITASELSILLFLYGKSGVSQEEMVSYLMIDKAAMARTIPSLIQKGYLRKEKDLTDKRANRIYITELALEKKDEFVEILKDWNRFLTEDMEEKEVETMYKGLERMVEKVESTDLKEVWRN